MHTSHNPIFLNNILNVGDGHFPADRSPPDPNAIGCFLAACLDLLLDLVVNLALLDADFNIGLVDNLQLV